MTDKRFSLALAFPVALVLSLLTVSTASSGEAPRMANSAADRTQDGASKALVFIDQDSRAALASEAARLSERAAVRELPEAIEVDAAVAQRFADQGFRVVYLPDPHRLALRDGTVDLRHHAVDPAKLPDEPVPLVVAFQGAPVADRTGRLEAAGASIVGHLPPSAYLVRADKDAAEAITALEGFATMATFEQEWKVSDRVPPGPTPTPVEVVVFSGADTDAVLEVALEFDPDAESFPVADRSIVTATLGPEGIAAVAELDEVEMVDAAAVGGFFNNEIRVVMQTEKAHFQANQAFYNPIYGIGVWGDDEIVTIADTGILAGHEVFNRPSKVLYNYAVPGTCATTGDAFDHGTGVAATLLGDKLGASGLYDTANDFDGVSLSSDLIVQDIQAGPTTFCPPADYPLDLFYPAWQVGSMVHSNSWGHWAEQPNPQGTYSWRSQAIDWYLHHPVVRQQAVIFAAGNAGATWDGQATYTPYSLSDEAHAKNAIVVGGTRNGNARDFVYTFSSRGPTDDCLGVPCLDSDGNELIPRVKPDVLAPAAFEVDTATTAGSSRYTNAYSGTSYSAPGVAGAASLVRDYFGQGIYPVSPSDPPLGGPASSALVKAMLVNATVPIYDPSGYLGNPLVSTVPADAYPNYDQGYGRPALDNVLDPAGYRKLKAFEDNTCDDGSLCCDSDSTCAETGDVWSRVVPFREIWGATCNTLRVTLVWNDKEASLAAGPKLVNDLDLEVTFQGQVWRGNHLLTGGAAFDRINNVEDVFVPLDQQSLGTLHQPVVRVYGTSVPSGPQPFAVVATYGTCFDNIPCPPPPVVGGCYRGPGDVVPGSGWSPPVPGCDDQIYSMGEFDGEDEPYPFCEPPDGIEPAPEPSEPVQVEPL